MQLFAVVTVRNKVDVLAINLRHHISQGIERFLVVDNGSSDGTDQILASFAEQGQLHRVRDSGPYYQSDITNDLAREAGSMGSRHRRCLNPIKRPTWK